MMRSIRVRPCHLRMPDWQPMVLSLLMSGLLSGVAAGDTGNGGLVDQLRANGTGVTKLGTAHGLAGFLVRPAAGPPYTLYVAPSGAGVVGQLYDAGGALLSRRQLAAALGKIPTASARLAGATSGPAITPAAGGATDRLLTSTLATGHAVIAGTPDVIVFADPGCRHSRDWLAALASNARGRYGLRLIPVAVLGEGSVLAALRVLAADNPVAAWSHATAAALPDDTFMTAAAAELTTNNALFARWQADAVPFTIYRSTTGQYRTREGAAADINGFLAGLPGPEGD